MKLAALSLVCSLLASLSAFADEPASSEADVEITYLAMCQPTSGPAKELLRPDNGDLKMRTDFLKFIVNPGPMVRALSQSSLVVKGKGDAWDTLGPLFTYSMTCMTADLIQSRVQARGCVDSKGRRYSVDKAVKLCAPLRAAIEKLRDEEQK